MIKAVIFDFDGTIVDTEKPAYMTWCEIFDRYGVALPLDVWVGCIGGGNPFDPVTYLEERFHGSIDRHAIEQERSRIYMERVVQEPLRSDILAYLLDAERLGLKIGVASSSPKRWVITHLERYGLLDKFDVIKTREDVSKIKPDPELYQAAMRALGLPGKEGVAIEDSRNGLLSAKAAGMYCIVSPCELTSHLDFHEADVILSSSTQLDLQTLISGLDTRKVTATQVTMQ